MKRKLMAALLALVMAAGMTAGAGALSASDFSGGALSGLAADGDALLVTDIYNKVLWRAEDGAVSRAAGAIGLTGLDGETKRRCLAAIDEVVGRRTLVLATHDTEEAHALGAETVAL